MNEPTDKYTPGVNTLILCLLENVVVPRVLDGQQQDRYRVGSVEVEGKLYALSFRLVTPTDVEVTVTRNSNVVKWEFHKDMFDKHLKVSHTPSPGAAGHAAYLNDPWLIMQIFTAYVDQVHQRGY